MDWKTLPIGGIAWTLFWLGLIVVFIDAPGLSTLSGKLVLVLFFSSFWLGGISFWRFVKDLLKSRTIWGFGKR